ncbi:hypothetical protein [Enterococcus sp. DIV0213h]|uniref:hypothetical protein n=1 Tax=Enterococcus sp. DIV0213h TaxID=2774669 RepID=UPI003F1F0122
MKNELKSILIDNEIITIEDLKAEKFKSLFRFYSIEKQTDSSIITILIADYRNINIVDRNEIKLLKKNLLELRNEIEKGEKIYELYVFFNDWEQERESLRIFLKESDNAKERKIVNDMYSFITSIYYETPEELHLKVDQEGINYLEMLRIKEVKLEAKIFNVSMLELKGLFNIRGKHLFKLNVRTGIENKKNGLELKEDFKNYLKVGLFNQVAKENTDTDLLDSLSNYFGITESTKQKFNPDIFWYKHNGINIYMDEHALLDTSTHLVKLNPKLVSVINGAQTLTNFFIAKDELIKEIEISDFQLPNLDIKMNAVLDSIIVKTIFIKGDRNLSKTITWGLNNQIPITQEDFIGVSKDIVELNKMLKKYQLKVLKTGEISKIYRGLSSLEFIKLFYIAKGDPGRSKNFNKTNLEKDIGEAVATIKDNEVLLTKIDIALQIGKWWDDLYRNADDKSIFLRYGKNYFQSFVVWRLDENDGLVSFIETDLEMYYEEIESLAKEMNIEINDYKSNQSFMKIQRKLSKSKAINIKENESNDDRALSDYVIKNKQNNYSVSSIIKRFNEQQGIDMEYFRTISYKGNKVKENFPFPNSTFEEFYKREKYMDDDAYPVFEDSLFLKEIRRKYPVYVIFLNENNDIKNVKFISSFSVTMAKDWKEKAEEAFNLVRKAFLLGDSTRFPKVSSNIGFHVRPKAANSKDTFQFSDGEFITRRTFWANSEYINKILLDNKLI